VSRRNTSNEDQIHDGYSRALQAMKDSSHALLNRVTELLVPVQVSLVAVEQRLEMIERRLQAVESYIEIQHRQEPSQ
jgi:hypothetical protein